MHVNPFSSLVVVRNSLRRTRNSNRSTAEKKASGDEGVVAAALKAIENTQTLIMDLAEEKPIVLAAFAGENLRTTGYFFATPNTPSVPPLK